MRICDGMNYTPTLTNKLLVAPLADAAEWDAFVEQAPGATFCHLAAWRHVVWDVMRQEACYLAAWDPEGSVRGVLPLVRLKSPIFGVRYVSVPYLNDGGPIGDPAALDALRQRALAVANQEGGRLELRTRAPLPGTTSECRKVTVVLGMPSEATELWSALPSKVRSQIRRPQKAGMTVQFGADQIPAFYEVWSQNMRDLGTPVLPRRFFDAVAGAFPDQFLVGCVYSDGKPVAAGAGFSFRDEFEITWASSLRRYNREAPNMMLYWEFMQRAIERGARMFNFGRCTPGEGTHRFKMQWGGETVPLPWLTYGTSGAASARQTLLFNLGSSAWQRLPVPLANAVGPIVARQLPWW